MPLLRDIARRSFTALLVAGLLAGSAGVHAGDRDDPFCDVGPIHDPSQHRVGPARGGAAPESSHCFLCHWQRSFRTVLVAMDRIDWRITASCEIVSESVPRQQRLIETSLPARAPPA